MTMLKKALFVFLLSIATYSETSLAMSQKAITEATELPTEEESTHYFFEEGEEDYFFKEDNHITVTMNAFIEDAKNFSTNAESLNYKLLEEKLMELAQELNKYEHDKELSFSDMYDGDQYCFEQDEEIDAILFRFFQAVQNKVVGSFWKSIESPSLNFLENFLPSLGTDLKHISIAGTHIFESNDRKRSNKIKHNTEAEPLRLVLLRFLCSNQELRSIDIDSNSLNDLSDEQLQHFFSTLLQKLPNLKSIDISYNYLSSRQVALIQKTIAKTLELFPDRRFELDNADNENGSDYNTEEEEEEEEEMRKRNTPFTTSNSSKKIPGISHSEVAEKIASLKITK